MLAQTTAISNGAFRVVTLAVTPRNGAVGARNVS